ncbi:MAG TPA: hypothetical protein VIR58_06250 [Acidimicrobiales bacterium]
MSIDEARMQLHEEARRALGDVAADVLMNALPADPEALATSSHVTDVGAEVRAEISKLDSRLAVTEANLRGDFKSSSDELLRILFVGVLAINLTIIAIAFAAARFT